MIDFTDIIGHEDIIRHFKSSIEMGKISQSYIINGETGSGKKTLTRALAKTLQCEEGGTEPCNKCKSCIQCESGNQPDIIWLTHDKPNVISVASNGNITAVGYGTATITASATDGSGISASVRITSVRAVESITVSPTSIPIYQGQTADISANVVPSNATFTDIDFSSSDSTIARVDSNGTVTGILPGVCYVTATSTDGNNVKSKVKVTVKPSVPATSVIINSSSITMLP
ncbi:MAG: Ig-like domain-containing protein, partial [Coprococcus sp.]